MKIKKLSISGFRCHKDLKITFEDDITLIVGENDSGKTSLIDCLKVITQNKPIEIDDFFEEGKTIEVGIETDDLAFTKIYELEGNSYKELPLEARPTGEFLRRLNVEISSSDFDLTLSENIEKIRNFAKLFGINTRSNSNFEKIREQILEIIKVASNDPTYKISDAQFPRFNNIQLDGKQFENVSSFFKEVFLKEKQGGIWQERINDDYTIEDFIKERIDSYSKEISEKLVESGIKEKIGIFLKNLTDIKIEPIYQSRDLNIDAKVKFLENGREIVLDKKGDGTKRRITMALLEFKKDQSLVNDDSSTIYLLDEPDTHLHVKAQIELLQTLLSFTENGNQVIITTHSPFLINAVKPNKIRLLTLDNQNCTKVKHLHDNPEETANILQSIGIENIYLFFARTIIIVEGKTEETFIRNFFLKKLNKTISSELIKIISVDGINNIYGFSRGISELHDIEHIFVVYDNELSEDMKLIVASLEIPAERQYILGSKEFEDAFSDEALFLSWKKYYEDNGHPCPSNWTIENIQDIRRRCKEDPNLKFSDELKHLNQHGNKMTKPIFAENLAKYIEVTDLPSRLSDLFNDLTK